MYSLCATAQTHASLMAVEAALGVTAAPAQVAARSLLLIAETAQEQARQALMDWPALLGEEPRVDRLAELRRTLSGLTRALYPGGDWVRLGGGVLAPDLTGIHKSLAQFSKSLERLVMGSDCPDGAVRNKEAFLDWATQGETAPARLFRHIVYKGWSDFGASQTPPMPDLDAAYLNGRLADDNADFVAAPDLDGVVYLTGPLSRQWNQPLVAELRNHYGIGLLTLFAARLIELWNSAQAAKAAVGAIQNCNAGAPPARATGNGLGMVDAARGCLVHRVEVKDSKIARYQILAPTEWNFHQEGPFVKGLKGASAKGIDALCPMLVSALDPCVACVVDVD